MTPEAGAEMLGEVVGLSVEELKNKVMSKATQGMHILRNAEIETLTNPSPAAPGNPPGIRTGALRNQWSYSVKSGGDTVIIHGEPGVGYAGYLENGTRKMAARPYVDKILETAEPELESLFSDL